MSTGLSRLDARFYGEPGKRQKVLARGAEGAIPSEEAEQLGLATIAADDIDFDDELRIAIEERASLSPDALTGMEASLRFVGPETLRDQDLRPPLGLAELDLHARQRDRRARRAHPLRQAGTPAVPLEEDLSHDRRDHRREDPEQRRPLGRQAPAARARGVAAEVHRLVEGDGPGGLAGATTSTCAPRSPSRPTAGRTSTT